MKSIIIAFFLFSSTAFAKPVFLNCKTKEAGGPNFQIRTIEGVVELNFQSSGDSADLVVHSGEVQIKDLAKLTKNANVLSRLGNQWKFRWKERDCTVYNPRSFHCFNGTEVMEINGQKVKGWGIYIEREDRYTLAGAYRVYTPILRLVIDEKHYLPIQFDFLERECKFAD